MSFGGRGFTAQKFTSSGNWVCPAGVTNVILIGCGGGQGGSGGCQTSTTSTPGGAGGVGVLPSMQFAAVTPGDTYAVSIGTGGAGGVAGAGTAPDNGGAGGNTLFGTLVKFFGGGRLLSSNQQATLFSGPPHESATYEPWSVGNSAFGADGSIGDITNGSAFRPGRGGGSGVEGSGGKGGNTAGGSGGNGAAGTGYGSGGGGGGNGLSVGGAGGNGAPGVLWVIWVE